MYARSQGVKRPRPSSTASRPAAACSSSRTEAEQSSKSAKPRPHVHPNITPRNKALMAEEMRENQYGDRLCHICSDTSTSRYHHHFSTADIRRMFLDMKVNQEGREYMCPICALPEPVLIPANETRRVVLSDSTMYGIWTKQVPPNTIHFDIESIVGGKVRDLKTALMKSYLHMPNRFEILVVAGLNDIGAGHKVEEIIADMKDIRQVVKEHSDRWRHEPASYVAFCTIPFAPKFCSLQVPPHPPEPEIAMWVPPANFRNRFTDMKSLVDKTLALNQEIGLTGVRFDYQGIKRFKSGHYQHIFDTKPGATPVWRETDVFRKLHFTMEKKLKMVSHITTCFRENTKRVSGHN